VNAYKDFCEKSDKMVEEFFDKHLKPAKKER
jgi:hypothetical protein